MDNSTKAPSSRGMLIPGKRGKLLANSYLPGGECPYPVVVLCHGIPGIERLFDFTIALREAGFATVNFHYSGNFGSDGDYSVLNCMEDTLSVMDYVRRNEFGDFDLSRVFLLGHSMGGLMAARTAALTPWVKAACIMVPMDFRLAGLEALEGREDKYKAEIIDSAAPWVRGLSWESFRADAERDLDAMDLIACAPALADRPVLTVAASLDTLLPKEEHIDRLSDAIEACGKGKLQRLCCADDHAFNRNRAAVREAVCAFFKAQM